MVEMVRSTIVEWNEWGGRVVGRVNARYPTFHTINSINALKR